MQTEQEEVEKAVAEKEAQAEEDLKEEAREELQAYKASDLAHILKAAETDAENECTALSERSVNKLGKEVESLVDSMTQSDSSLLTAA